MTISWQAAMRLYAKQRGAFIVPKKGSAEYEAIKKLQAETEMGPEHEVKKRQSKKTTIARGTLGAAGLEMKLEAGAGPAGEPKVPPPAQATKPIDPGSATQKEKRQKKKVENAAEIPVKESKGVSRTGKTHGANTQDFLENRNTGMSAVVSAQLPEQKAALEANLKANKRTTKIVSTNQEQEKTIDGMKTDDPAAISARAPFSIQALRNKLLA